MSELYPSVSVLGEPLESCSHKPLTGFTRNGCCETMEEDLGSHTVCIQVNNEFLAFSKARGNDLSTAVAEFGFPGLRDGDRWCLCAVRWLEALNADAAPRVILRATHQRALDIVSFGDLKRYAIDLS